MKKVFFGIFLALGLAFSGVSSATYPVVPVYPVPVYPVYPVPVYPAPVYPVPVCQYRLVPVQQQVWVCGLLLGCRWQFQTTYVWQYICQ